ncbi:hypothetical protein M2451_003734 [Dysgonomonas sp. PFB1-18]|nr:hypothetical protein [Dysgonomonas sp. PF1-14]MDH6340772.1 hypothetical protein [Dysgonomonas sp. PF1-16]MDH6382393.1 hypothetical protein [Dysgonomonas sp. PFB1-18]MDH6399707.1 hypothetical protein [Dysgonomonas sp. PF1-23]
MISEKTQKFITRCWEILYPYVFSSLGIIFVLIFRKNELLISLIKKILSSNILEIIITIESILFGFLLTILSLIIQMDNRAINAIKECGRYNQLIGFSKSAVFGSLITVILSLVLILINDYLTQDLFSYIVLLIWGFFFQFSLLSLYRFVHIFYILAKSA